MTDAPLYLVWPPERLDNPPTATVPDGYRLTTTRSVGDVSDLIGTEWPFDGAARATFRDRLIPGGLRVVERDGDVVSAAAALHNPRASDHYFPFGGEVGYVVTHPRHRERGLGRAVTAAVVSRLLDAGYANVRVSTEERRLPAVSLYLSLGFRPFCHAPGERRRWRRIHGRLDRPFDPSECLTPGTLPRRVAGEQ